MADQKDNNNCNLIRKERMNVCYFVMLNAMSVIGNEAPILLFSQP